MTDGQMEILIKIHEIILGLECFYQRRKKQDGWQERREIYYTKKAKKLEVRECVVCFFLCLRVYETFDERERKREWEGRGKVEFAKLEWARVWNLFVILSINVSECEIKNFVESRLFWVEECFFES